LIDRAGGLKREASGTVRIFLHGRLEQEFHYDDSRRMIEVAPESVIVVDSSTSRPHETSRQDAGYCDVACINLLDRPVVRRMSAGDATLFQLLSTFGQSDALAGSVRVMRKSRMTVGISDRLSSGDVLVFDRSNVNQSALNSALERIPLQDLQPDDGAGTDTAVGAARGGTEGAVAPTERTSPHVTRAAAEAGDPNPESSAPRRASLEIISTLSAGEPRPAPPMEPVAVEALVQDNRFLARSIGAALQAAGASESGWNASAYVETPGADGPIAQSVPEPPQEPDTSPRHARPSATRDVAVRTARRPETHSGPQSSTTSGVVATAVAAGLCAFFALTLLSVWSRRNRVRGRGLLGVRPCAIPWEAAPPAAPEPSLEEMINDAIPLVEEAPAFPAQMVFHGRALGFRYLLFSGPHGRGGPHFTAGQVHPRLWDHAESGGARTGPRIARPPRTHTTPAETAEAPSSAEGERTADVFGPNAVGRMPEMSQHDPSPLERALLSRRRRDQP
jgi:hypothetical protein